MENVTNLQPKKHLYETDYCAGCGSLIVGEYTELGLPSTDDSEVKHIALCGHCSGIAEGEGVI